MDAQNASADRMERLNQKLWAAYDDLEAIGRLAEYRISSATEEAIVQRRIWRCRQQLAELQGDVMGVREASDQMQKWARVQKSLQSAAVVDKVFDLEVAAEGNTRVKSALSKVKLKAVDGGKA